MSTQAPTGPGAQTTQRFREAVEAGDVEAFLATLSPDVVVHSPITARRPFHGHAEVRALMHGVLDAIKDIRYTEDFGDDRVRALSYRARVGRQEAHEATIVHLDEQGRVSEIYLWFRPLPGLTAVMGALAPRLAAPEQGPVRARVVGLLIKPIVLITRLADLLSVRLLPRWPTSPPPGR